MTTVVASLQARYPASNNCARLFLPRKIAGHKEGSAELQQQTTGREVFETSGSSHAGRCFMHLDDRWADLSKNVAIHSRRACRVFSFFQISYEKGEV